MTPVAAEVSPGDIIAGRYRVEAWVGQGNMARVFHATHLFTGKACALKLVHAHLVERSEVRDLFVQEARVGARIGKHPNIVDVFDAGVDVERGVPFLAMDLLEGTTLDKYVAQYGQLPAGLLQTLWLQLADALEQAHAAGVVHRDLKPGNLFLTYDRKGNPQLHIVDFGIAKLLEEGYQKTATQIGSPAYAAPEQLGEGVRKIAARMGMTISSTISPATDIWALGVMTYELLTGAPSGQLWLGSERGAMADLLIAVATGPTPSAGERAGSRAILLPPGFDAWLERCLQRNSADRWPSIEVAVRNLISLFNHPEREHVLPQWRNDRPSPPSRVHQDTLRLPSSSASMGAAKKTLKTELMPPAQPISRPTEPIQPSNLETLRLDASEMPRALQTAVPRSDATAMDVGGTWTNPRRARSKMLGLSILGAVFLSAIGMVIILRNSDKPHAQNAETQERPATNPAPSTAFSSRPNTPSAEPNPSNESTAPTVDIASPIPPAAPTPTLWGSLPGKTSAPNSSSAPTPSPSASAASTASPSAPGTLNINSSPVSKVILDGRPLGSTPKVGVSVPAGSHTVIFVHPEKGKRSVTVVVGPRETKTAAVKFE